MMLKNVKEFKGKSWLSSTDITEDRDFEGEPSHACKYLYGIQLELSITYSEGLNYSWYQRDF